MKSTYGNYLVALVAIASCAQVSCKAKEHAHYDKAGGHAAGDHAGRADHGGGELEAIGITRYTDKLELFAEHPPAIAGQELPFLAHITILDGFAALENASVTLKLDGPSPVQAQVKAKLRPGIFRPTLTAPAAGTYRGTLVVSGPQVEDTISDFEIVVHANVVAAQAAAAAELANQPAGGTEPITFLKEQQWQIPFATAFAATGAIVPTVETAGEVTTPPNGQAEVSAAVAGRLVAPPGGFARPGQKVRHGQVLATIAAAPSSPEAGASAELAVVSAEVRLQAGRAAVERAERLIADRAISQREVDDARREVKVAEVSVAAARRARAVFAGAASGQGAGTYRLTSPIDGEVAEVKATTGKTVAAGEMLFHIVDIKEVWIRARVPERNAAALRSDQNAAYLVPGIDTWQSLIVSGKAQNASLISASKMIDARSRTVDVLYGITKPNQQLRIGAMLRVAVPIGEAWNGVVVPRGAVLEFEGRTVVYVQIEGEAFQERVVELGTTSGDMVGIKRGIKPNERIVTRGANVIRLTALSPTAPAHGHVH